MVFPILVVAACVGVFLIFGWISYEPKSLSDYLLDMRTGGASRRWHAAFELSKKLANQQGMSLPDQGLAESESGTSSQNAGAIREQDQGFVASLLELYEKSRHDDPRLRQYLVLCLGYVKGPGVREALVESLSDTDPVVRFYAVWSLAVQQDISSVPRLLDMLGQEDTDLRKVIVYALGVLHDPRALPSLKAALNDAEPDIQWNAALALARFGDAAGQPILMKMLDRDYLKQMGTVRERQIQQVMINAVRAAALLKDAQMTQRLEQISASDRNLKVRQAALQALTELKK